MAQKTVSSEERHLMMTTAPITGLILKLSGPTILAQLVTILYNTADTYFVSSISTSASAAVGVCYSLASIIQAVGFGFAMGINSLISRRLGAKDNESANMYAISATVGAALCGLLITVGGLLTLDWLMDIMGSTETILPYAKAYARWILIIAPISCINSVLVCVLRAEGSVKISTIATTSGCIVNCFLDPLFISVFHMGTAGAALATALSQCVTTVICLSIFFSGKSIVKLKLSKTSKKFSDYSQIILTGLPTVCRQGMGSIATALINRKARFYGDAAVAAVTIANKVYMLMRNIIIGVGQAFQPVAGYNYGAGIKSRTKKAFWVAVIYGTILSTAAAAIIALIAPGLMSVFRADDAVVIEFGARMLRFMSLSLPILAYSTFVNQLYQCLGYKWTATLLACCRQGIFFVPLVLILPNLLAETGIQMTQAAADILTALVSVPFNISFFRKHLRNEEA